VNVEKNSDMSVSCQAPSLTLNGLKTTFENETGNLDCCFPSTGLVGEKMGRKELKKER
jgi:hypothetical protein